MNILLNFVPYIKLLLLSRGSERFSFNLHRLTIQVFYILLYRFSHTVTKNGAPWNSIFNMKCDDIIIGYLYNGDLIFYIIKAIYTWNFISYCHVQATFLVDDVLCVFLQIYTTPWKYLMNVASNSMCPRSKLYSSRSFVSLV